MRRVRHRVCLLSGRKIIIPFISVFLASFGAAAQNTSLVVAAGNLVVGNGSLILHNTDLLSNGAFDASAASVWITGGNSSSFSGTATPLIQVLNLNTAATATLTLHCPVSISSALIFKQGVIDLNNQQMLLTGNATLQTETEASHITGITGGSVAAAATGVANPNHLNIGNLGAVLTTTSNLGDVSVARSHKPAINPANSSLHSIQRTFLIEPQNNASLSATLRFYYLDEELNGDDASSLTLWKSIDGITWNQIGADAWNVTEKYVEKTGLADFSYWTLTDAGNPLPLILQSFSVVCQNNEGLIKWQTGLESDLNQFVVEKSSDANSWSTLGEVPATNIPNGATYSFEDRTPSANAFYRLKIIDDAGKFSYSPVFQGGCSSIALPFIVYPNPAYSQAIAQIAVRETTITDLQVFTTEGKLMYKSQWKLGTGINQLIVPVSGWAPGTYIVKLRMNGTVLEKKLIKN